VGVDARKLIIVDKFAFASVAKAVFVAKDLTPVIEGVVHVVKK
jgi:hypothetical protein